jgi:eukaryotic-like serine/threonine-protein kinase
VTTAGPSIRPPAVRSGVALPSTEEGRAFLQERLAFYGKIAFLLSGTFLVVGVVMAPEPETGGEMGPLGYFVLANLLLLGMWIYCSWGAHSLASLRTVDAAVPVLYCLASAIRVFSAPSTPADEVYGMLLAMTNIVIGRAVFVPSAPGRTFGIAVASALAPFAAVWMFQHDPERTAGPVKGALFTLFGFLWCGCAVTVATVTSRIIYGLRERVREAMQIGQYTLVEKLGGGGMGDVYKATHAFLRRPTAVKLLPPEKTGESSLRRFEREVQLTSQLTHPNTIAIFDYGHTPSGIFYYAMEYLDGIDLDRLVREDGAQPPARAAHVLRQIAGSLQEAHEAGIVHRDVKPANVILCRRGGSFDVAKVVDFGLVKDLQANESVELTGANTITGTPLYMSPEAIKSPEDVGPASDIYALGGVGYFLLCGKPPFEGSLIEVCGHHLHTIPPPPSERLGRPLPADLEALLLRCLDKDKERRPRSAEEVAESLKPLADAWTRPDARRWWTETGNALRDRAQRPAVVDESAPTRTILVNLQERGRRRA